MLELVSNPNYNSSLVMRADIVWDDGGDGDSGGSGSGGPYKLGGYGCGMMGEREGEINSDITPRGLQVRGYCLTRSLVRRIVPRNPAVDRYLLQSCLFYREHLTGSGDGENNNDSGLLVIYLPHASSADEIPFYHPPVQGVAFLHKRSTYTSLSPQKISPTTAAAASFIISIHHLPFQTTNTSSTPNPNSNPSRLPRILHNLLCTLTKHGSGILSGYTKRVHHDQLISRSALQDRYLHLKQTHAKRLMEGWVERTDPRKHVFEDLLIAAFLIEWWHEVYDIGDRRHKQDGQSDDCELPNQWQQQRQRRPWVGFVDIGCGNGVLVDILRREGWNGWGFDARRRKSWDVFLPATAPSSSSSCPSSSTSPWLREMLLIPSILNSAHSIIKTNPDSTTTTATPTGVEIHIHPGIFPRHTFLISNHSDQLTGWTPLLAAQSDCPFLAIPCCSYNLSGEKFRARTPHTRNYSHSHNCNNSSPDTTTATATATESGKPLPQSAYAALCAWTEALTGRVGWVVEKEVLRIPSTRNTGILGRKMQAEVCADVQDNDKRPRRGGPKEGQEDEKEAEDRVRRVLKVLEEEGGADGWVEKCMELIKGFDRESFTH